MTRSMFDPTSGDRLDEGSTFTRPSGQNSSHMPSDVVDGVVDEDTDQQIPLKGSAEHGLDPKATEQLAEAAEEARAHPNNPDDIAAPTGRRNPGDAPKGDQGTGWMEDT